MKKNSFKVFKVKLHKIEIVPLNLEITFQQDHIMLYVIKKYHYLQYIV